jgi:hypothetical protein
MIGILDGFGDDVKRFLWVVKIIYVQPVLGGFQQSFASAMII